MARISKTNKGVHLRPVVDQVRKADRKRELKKNKHHRQQVRSALARFGCNEENIEKLLQIEKQLLGIDDKKFNHEVLAKKQRLLLSSFERSHQVLSASTKEEDKASLERLNNMLKGYYSQCSKLRRDAEMLRLARSTDVDDIPMPVGHFSVLAAHEPPDPREEMRKQRRAERRRRMVIGSRVFPPGVPIGLPPDFSDSDDEDGGTGEGMIDDDDLRPVPIPMFLDMPATMPIMMPLRAPPRPPPMPEMPAPMGASLVVGPMLLRETVDAVIAAQPQLRDLTSESTRLVPAQLLRPRQTGRPAKPLVRIQPSVQAAAKSTDEAYEQFMKELADIA